MNKSKSVIAARE